MPSPTAPAPIAEHTATAAAELQREWRLQAFLAANFIGTPGNLRTGTADSLSDAMSKLLMRTATGCIRAVDFTYEGKGRVELFATNGCRMRGHSFKGKVDVNIVPVSGGWQVQYLVVGTLDGAVFDGRVIHEGFKADSLSFETLGRLDGLSRLVEGTVTRTGETLETAVTLAGIVEVAPRSASLGTASCGSDRIDLAAVIAAQDAAACAVVAATFSWTDLWTCGPAEGPMTAGALRHDGVWASTGEQPITGTSTYNGASNTFTSDVPTPAACGT